jgi:hypothetical protein
MEILAEIKHYPNTTGSVDFYAREINPKKQSTDTDYITNYSLSIPFAIWQKFKDSKVKIVVTKIDE